MARKTIEQMLNDAMKNSYGYVDAAPGTDMYSRLAGCTDHAKKEMVTRGYLKKVGSGLVLTKYGYETC